MKWSPRECGMLRELVTTVSRNCAAKMAQPGQRPVLVPTSGVLPSAKEPEGCWVMGVGAACVVSAQVVIEYEARKAGVLKDIRQALDAKRGGNDNPKIAISLSGAGFLGAYHFGVIRCLQTNAKALTAGLTHFAGASVGSLLAALLVFNPAAVEEGLQTLFELADELHSKLLGALTPGYNIAQRLCDVVENYIPEDIERAQGRLFISVTRHNDRENRIISSYPDRKYLLNCLVASCFIPFYSIGSSAKGVLIDDEICIDGALSNNLPTFDHIPTLTVSPFSGSAMISPNDVTPFDWTMKAGDQIIKVNLKNIARGAQALFPPSRAVLQRYYLKGYKNTMLWLINNDLIEREAGSEI